MAVVAMGKLGARELNYGSDIDIMLVGAGDPHPMLALARQAWRTDLDLRPEGRAGVLVRSLASYQAYWDRWAQTWEFQALLKARPAAGHAGLGAAFAHEAAKQGLGPAPGRRRPAFPAGHEGPGRADRRPPRPVATGDQSWAGAAYGTSSSPYSCSSWCTGGRTRPCGPRPPWPPWPPWPPAATWPTRTPTASASAYRFLRAVEHRLQLFEDRQVHAVPASAPSRAHLARVLGYRDGRSASALARFEADLAHHQATARTIHERLFFRPLLEVFSAGRAAAHLGRRRPDRAGPGAGPGWGRCRRAWPRARLASASANGWPPSASPTPPAPATPWSSSPRVSPGPPA